MYGVNQLCQHCSDMKIYYLKLKGLGIDNINKESASKQIDYLNPPHIKKQKYYHYEAKYKQKDILLT